MCFFDFLCSDFFVDFLCFFDFLFLWFCGFVVFYSIFFVVFGFFCLFVVLCFFYDLYKSTVNMKKKKSYFRIHLLLLGITDWCDDYILLR